MARDIEFMGETVRELSGEFEACLRFTLVPKGMANKLTIFEIDSQHQFYL